MGAAVVEDSWRRRKRPVDVTGLAHIRQFGEVDVVDQVPSLKPEKDAA